MTNVNPGDRAQRFYRNNIGRILFTVLFLLSLLLMSIAHGVLHEGWGYEIVRDVGIGFLVAAVVGGIYDLHARQQFDHKTISDVLSTTMGEIVRNDIWEEVKKQIIERNWIRENLHVKLELRESPETESHPGEMVLWIQLRYDICNLRGTPQCATIQHNLDEHRRRGLIPRYLHARVDEQPVSLDSVRDGMFKYDVDLEPRGGRPIRVLVEREEVVYVPGTYVLTTATIVRGLSIELEGVPGDYRASVLIRPHREEPIQMRVHDMIDREFDDILLLPGQVLEFRFHPVAQLAVSSNTGESAHSTVPVV